MSRDEQLNSLQIYMKDVDKDITMILQHLQWDRSFILNQPTKTMCKYDKNHLVPTNRLREHEERCFLKCHGYTEESLLPALLDENKNTVIKLNAKNIKDIIDKAAESDPTFKRGNNSEEVLPLSLDRLQATYTADERRAIHDAVVSSVKTCHELSDFPLPSSSNADKECSSRKSRLEELAALRDRRRRRAKYRVPNKTRNYSDVLRDVISAQMEIYNEAQANMDTTDSTQKVDYKNDTFVKSETSGHIKHDNNKISLPHEGNNRHERNRLSELRHKEREDSKRSDRGVHIYGNEERKSMHYKSSSETDRHKREKTCRDKDYIGEERKKTKSSSERDRHKSERSRRERDHKNQERNTKYNECVSEIDRHNSGMSYREKDRYRSYPKDKKDLHGYNRSSEYKRESSKDKYKMYETHRRDCKY